MIRINKYIAECGVCSRRKADELIQNKKVLVNGKIIDTLGLIIDEDNDVVIVNNKVVKKEEKLVYIMLNKPKGYVTTSIEQFGRKSVLDLVDIKQRIYPIGRLDMYTEGLLLLTNDGDFANRLMHPKNKIKKTYIVKVKGNVTEDKIQKLRNGIDIGGYITKKAEVTEFKDGSLFQIVISEGKNRQVRKMCESVGLQVINLKRVKIGNLELGNLPVGKYRFLNDKNINEIIE